MNIHSAKFIKGIIGTNGILYDGKFQVAFIGRSNVGKSTLINSLTLRKDLARSSAHPGRTIRLDFFLINDSLYFVDLPGYGYAKRSEEKREKIAKMILWYLLYSEVKDRLVILIIDAKVGLTPYDLDMLKTIREAQIDHIIVANKIDNLKMGQAEKKLGEIKEVSKGSEVVPYTSKEKRGRDQLIKSISSHIPQLFFRNG